MSDTGSKPEAEDAPDGSADAEFPDEDTLDPQPSLSVARNKSPFSPIAWLALLLALTALAGVGWLWILQPADAPQTDSASKASVDSLTQSLATAENTLAATQDRLSQLINGESARATEVATRQRQLQQRLDSIESVPGRLTNLEGSIASLQGISSGVRDTWLIAEAEYYMQIANAQLQLAGNPHLAGLALRLADEKVLQLANPALTNVRRAIANEIRAVDAMDKPDIEGITLTLASLAGVVDTLPLKRQTRRSADDETEIDPELSGVDRAIETLKGAMNEIVSVRQIEEAERPFVAPEAEYFLRANLSLQLQTARLALLRGERAVFQQSIDDASAWLNSYYDTDSTPVQSALQTIDELRGGLYAISPPDISESLQLLRQFNTLSEYSTDTPAETAPEIPAETTVETPAEPEPEQ